MDTVSRGQLAGEEIKGTPELTFFSPFVWFLDTSSPLGHGLSLPMH